MTIMQICANITSSTDDLQFRLFAMINKYQAMVYWLANNIVWIIEDVKQFIAWYAVQNLCLLL